MGKRESVSQFQKANQFYVEKRYAEALTILDELDRKYPGQKNVMLPRARCLHHLGRSREAIQLCQEVAVQFGDQHATELAAKFQGELAQTAPRPSTAFEDVEMPALDQAMVPSTSFAAFSETSAFSSASKVTPKHPQPPARNWYKYAAFGILGILIVTVALLPVFVGGDGQSNSKQIQQAEAETRGSPFLELSERDGQIAVFGYIVPFPMFFTFVTASALIWGIFQYSLVLYLTLYLLGRLPHDDSRDNLQNVIRMSVMGNLLFFLCCIGLIIHIKMLMDTYDFGIVELLILLAVSIGVGVGFDVIFYGFMIALRVDFQSWVVVTP